MACTRRQFLSRSLIAGAAGLVPGLLTASCAGVRRSDVHLKEKESLPDLMGLDRVRTDILYHASLAPSGHNAQPWTVRIGGDEWVIGLDPKRRLPAVDPENRETLLSLGAFAENLFLAAGAYGFDAEMEVIAQHPDDADIIRVLLKPTAPREYPLERLRLRRTVRNGFLSGEILTSDIEALSALLPGQLLYIPAGTPHADCIRDGAVEFFRQQAFRDAAQAELVRWLRLDSESALRHRDGLSTAGMEIEGVAGWFVRSFVDPEDFMKTNFRQKGVDLTAKLAGEGAGWLIITSPGNSISDIVDTGRKFERMALLAREKKIAIHPMSQFLEEEEGRNVIAMNHPPEMVPQFLLRVGYLATYPEPVSLRRPVGWFVRV